MPFSGPSPAAVAGEDRRKASRGRWRHIVQEEIPCTTRTTPPSMELWFREARRLDQDHERRHARELARCAGAGVTQEHLMSAGLAPTTTGPPTRARCAAGVRAIAPVVAAYLPFGLVVGQAVAASSSP